MFEPWQSNRQNVKWDTFFSKFISSRSMEVLTECTTKKETASFLQVSWMSHVTIYLFTESEVYTGNIKLRPGCIDWAITRSMRQGWSLNFFWDWMFKVNKYFVIIWWHFFNKNIKNTVQMKTPNFAPPVLHSH